ncbi:MAG: hypothetical protein KA116_04690 [Proteobacteria bacterium]|nr:hypothetical protein [Pseudomonadota bacterium]
MTNIRKKTLELSLSLIFLLSVVFERQVLGEGMNATGTLASMGGTILTGIGVQGMMSHSTPCISQSKDCDKLALDVGMVAGGILAMLAGQSTSDSSSGNNSNLSNLNNNGGGGDDNNNNPFGNYNFNNNFNTNYNSNYNSNFNNNFNYNNNDDDDDNNNNNTLCPNGICSIPPPVYDGINKYIDGLSDGSIEPPEGQSPSEAINLATANLAQLEGALGELQENLKLDKDTYYDPSRRSSSDEDLGDLQSSNSGPSKNGNNPNGSLRFNGLEVEDVDSGRKLSLFERATRRYNGTRDYNRAFTVARLEVFRKRALQLAKNSKTIKAPARSPASNKR